MIKRLCDICHGEITSDSDNERLRLEKKDLMFEVISGARSVWNGAHLHHICILKMFADEYTERMAAAGRTH